MTNSLRSGTVYITQGEHAVGSSADLIVSTTLGSCVAVCLWDEERCVGGMNHILLPGKDESNSRLRNFGGTAMDRLVNAVVKLGGEKERLQAKVFGGAAMIAGLSDIGARNAAFVLEYLEEEGIACVAKSVGGTAARQVRFWPHSGRARQRFVKEFTESLPAVPEAANGVELF